MIYPVTVFIQCFQHNHYKKIFRIWKALQNMFDTMYTNGGYASGWTSYFVIDSDDEDELSFE